jgi:hypothetical protein
MARRSSVEPYFNIALEESRVDTLRSNGDELAALACAVIASGKRCASGNHPEWLSGC